MSDIKRVKNFNRSRRTAKIIDTLAAKQKRETALLLELDRLADKVLSGKAAPAPTADELQEMKRTKPEVFDLVDSLLYVAEKVGNLPPVPPGQEYDGSVVVQKMDGSRVKCHPDGTMEILSGSSANAPVIAPDVENDATQPNDALQPPALPADLSSIAELVRSKNYRR